MPSEPLTTTFISVPFLTAGIDGCTALFSDVDITTVDEVIVLDFTGPVIFVGIAKVSVLVTSPFALVETVFISEGDGEGEAVSDGEGAEVGFGVGVDTALELGLGVGDAVTVGEGDGLGEIVGVGPGLPPPPPPPPPPESGAVAAMIEKVLVIEVAAA